MNKQCYRVVFNKARGMMMVVSEITKSKTKSAGDSKRGNTATSSTSTQPADTFSYRRLVMAVLCCQSMIYTQVQAATSAVQNTASSIPTAQRAALLKATNGTPIVNIRTPNSKGLSHNTYNQFDIGSNGAILNNSLGGATTQLAGAIAGNQYLAQGVANTILNEVRSSAPVKFEGNLEVAGQRADVIIASPSGLQVQGGGFINANRATLTTGTPKIDSAGNLTGFDVKQGQIQFDNAATGNALGGDLYDGKNKNQANYVDVLARAVMINGQIHANQNVDIITGSNTVDYDTGTAKTIVGTGTRPTLAVDVSALGGIYANSINLVGTENGLGVRNAGNIKATQQVVLTNSGKIENTSAIETTKAQTSLVSINATGTTGGIEHSGKISSYGMIDIQADRDISLDNGIVYKHNAGQAEQLMPDILRIDAKLNISLKNKSSVRNFEDKADTSLYMHSRGSTTVDTESMIGSEGGVSMDAGGYMNLLGKSTVFARKAPLVIHSNSTAIIDDTLVSSRDALHISADDGTGNRPANAVIRNNARLYADKDITINAAKSAYLLTGSRIVKSDNLHVTAAKSVTVQESGQIDVGGNAVFTAAETAYINRNSKPINIGKKLIIDSGQTTVLNSTANAIEGIDISSQGKDTTITNSHLNSEKGAVVAIARQAALTVKNLNTDANSTILAATGDMSIAGSNLTADSIVIESGKDLTLSSVTVNAKDKNNAGDVVLQSNGKVDITSSHLNSGKNLAIDSKGFLSLHGSELNAANNLALEGYRIYSNTVLSQNSEGKYYHDYEVNNEQSKLTAGDALLLDSESSQYYTNTDLTGSAIVSNSTRGGHGLYYNLNITATGNSKNIDKEVNGDIQISNKNSVYLDNRHKLNAKNDVVINADKVIRLYKVADLSADRIYLKTNVKNTAKNTKEIYNTSGDGDINIYNSNIKTRSTKDSSFTVDAANHLNLINANINSAGTSTLKSGNLMRVNNSTLDADKHLNINSGNQLIFNGARTANTNTGLTHVAGNTTLKAGQIVSIDSNAIQSYQNTDVTGGAVLINSANSIGFNTNTTVKATGSTKLATSKEKLLDGKAVNTLNGALAIGSGIGDLTIDPKNITLNAAGDMSLAARGGKLHLKGYAGTQGLGSEQVMKLTAGGDINLSGKEVVVEGSDLTSGNLVPIRVVPSGPTVTHQNGIVSSSVTIGYQNKITPIASINITATDGNVELKGIKSSFTNYVSPHKMKAIQEQIKNVQEDKEKEMYSRFSDKERDLYATYSILEAKVRPISCDNFDEPPCRDDTKEMVEITKNPLFNKQRYYEYSSMSWDIVVFSYYNANLNRISEVSKKASTGFEHKAVSLTAGKDINITAKQGVLIEGADITSDHGGINILAEGNLAPTERRDKNDKKIGINHDSLVITGLADIYQQGDMKEGKNTGPNYSYHQLNNQPKLTAKGDIKVSALGNRPLNQASNVYTDNNAVVINSADIVSTNGDVYIDAARGDINLQASQVAFMDGSQHKKTSHKWYGKKKTKITTKVTDNSNAVTTDINANNIYLNAESDIDIYGSQLEASPTGIIKATAGRELYFRKIDDRAYSETDVRKKSSFRGIRYNKDHTNDTRQEITQLPVELVATMAKTKSGGNTVLEGTVFNTENQDEIQVGFGKYAKEDAKVIFDVVQHQISTTHNQERESTVWMKTVEERDTVTTADLPKFNQTPKITGPNGKLIDIKIPVDVDISDNNEAKLKIQHSQEALGKIALKLATQPGYEYLAELDKNNDINWVQVQLIQEHFKFEQEGLTPAAAALIAIAVSMATGGVGGAAGMGASITGTTGAMGAASTAAFSSLASQAAVTLINNKGDIGKTFKDMSSSETIRGMATAALTAGTLQYMNTSVMPGVFKNLSITDLNSLQGRLVNGVFEGTTSALITTGINGGSLSDNLELSLLNSGINAAHGFAASEIKTTENNYILHKVLHAVVGCASAAAKKADCTAGAIGASVGEVVAELLPDPNMSDDYETYKAAREKQLFLSQFIAGTIATVAGYDAVAAIDTAQTAVANNRQFKQREIERIKQLAAKNPKANETDYIIAGCAVINCSAHLPVDSIEYKAARKIEIQGATAKYASLRAELSAQVYETTQYLTNHARTSKEKLFEATPTLDKASVLDAKYQIGTRAGGVLITAGGTASGAVSAAGLTTCATGVGCALAGAGLLYSSDIMSTGLRQAYSGKTENTLGAQALHEVLNIPISTAELVYGATGIGLEVGIARNALKLAVSTNKTTVPVNAGQGNKGIPSKVLETQATQKLLNEIDAFPSVNQARKTSTMIGAYDPVTGRISVGKSGPIKAEDLDPKTVFFLESKLGVKIGELTGSCKNAVGICAEVNAADQLVRQGSDPSKIKFTEALIPRLVKQTGIVNDASTKSTCKNCKIVWPTGTK